MKVNGKLLQFNLYMLTKLQKISFGKIKKPSPTEAPTHTNSEIIPTQLPSSLTPALKHHHHAAFMKIVDKNSLQINISNYW